MFDFAATLAQLLYTRLCIPRARCHPAARKERCIPGGAIEAPDTLYGLYLGTPITDRRWDDGNREPDQIVLYQGPHEEDALNEDDLVAMVAETLIHEIGHYFGMSEEEIQEVEEHFWAEQDGDRD